LIRWWKTNKRNIASDFRTGKKTHNLRQNAKGYWYKDAVLVVPPDERLQRALVELNHDSTTAAHPGVVKTCYALMKQYWWPGCRKFVQQYVNVKATAGLGTLALSDGVWADPQRCLSVQ
jgi:hypothetical protein